MKNGRNGEHTLGSKPRFRGTNNVARFNRDQRRCKKLSHGHPKRHNQGFWRDSTNQREYLEWLGIQLGYKTPTDWYAITKAAVQKYGGDSLLRYYSYSPIRILQSLHPDHNWLEWKFTRVPTGFWNLSPNRNRYIRWLSFQLPITKLDDWYRISFQQISKIGPVTPFDKGFAPILGSIYPQHSWDSEKLVKKSARSKSSQRMLVIKVQLLFPTLDVHEDYVHEELRFESGLKMQLDVFIPAINIALEYQGEQHYHDVFGTQWRYTERDRAKRKACQIKGITLIEIPYWWEFDVDSLQATIHHFRPDVIQPSSQGKIIPLQPVKPSSNRSPLMLAESWTGAEDPTGWWMREKLEGVRAYWDGHSFFSKQGYKISTPNSFVDGLPDTKMDGELWIKRGAYGKLNGLLKSHEQSWEAVKFVVSDLPSATEPFESRQESLNHVPLPQYVQVAQIEKCQGTVHLTEFLNGILEAGGIGVSLIRPGSLYTAGKSQNMFECKQLQDCEVRLLEILPTGLSCQQPNGRQTTVCCPSQVLNDPPSVGSVLVVKHSGYYTNGTLRHSFFWREHPDLEWPEPLRANLQLAPSPFWANKQNRQSFFSWLWNELGLESIEDWYRISPDEINTHGASGLLRKIFSRSLWKALTCIYPEHKWQHWRFSEETLPRGYWKNKENVKEFLAWVGKQLKFTRLEDWYSITADEIKRFGGAGLLDDNVAHILSHFFPDHAWDYWRFKKVPTGFWQNQKNQQYFISWLGKELRVFNLQEWYRVSLLQIQIVAPTTLFRGNGAGLGKVLMNLYPSHDWNQTKKRKQLRSQFLKSPGLDYFQHQLMQGSNLDSCQ